jgi:two-component system, LytTR family, sensor histidine kinase AlgZ
LRDSKLFLPDFCDVRSLFVLVMVAELLVFVLVLAGPVNNDPWQALSLTSLFVQWIALASAGLLCLLRPLLARFDNVPAALLSYLLILAVTAAVSGFGHWLLEPSAPGHYRQELMLRSLGVAAIVAAVALRYLYVQHEWKRRLESEASARIEALQARIRPHFLFNSLNTIASMIPQAPADAEAAVEDLADLFRASLSRGERMHRLHEELALAKGYLQLERLRLSERLQVEWDVEALPEDALLPPLSLQPLLENAVYYGIEPRLEGGLIRIRGEREGDMLTVTLCNPSPPQGGTLRQGMGMAQENIRERLLLALGRKSELTVSAGADEYRVTLTLPYVSQVDENPDR